MTMKKYIESLFMMLFAIVLLASCTEDEGAEPGSSSLPSVMLYSYSATAPNDPDNDLAVKLAANNASDVVYYLAEKTSDKVARGLSDADYADYIISNGNKVSDFSADGADGAKISDVVVKDMKGDYTISAVAVNGKSKSKVSSITFFGPDWVTIANGTYNFSSRAQSRLGVNASIGTSLQYLATSPTTYRLKNIYGIGHSLNLTLTENTGSDNTGKLQYLRVAAQATPYEYSSYGTVNVRDLGYWQNDDSFAYGTTYGCYIYTENNKNTMVIPLQYYVSASSLGYGVDEFVPE